MTVRAKPSARGSSVFEALVDTGASKTIVSEAVARKVGIRAVGYGGVSGVGGMVRVKIGAAYAKAHGCPADFLWVGISDVVTEGAGAEVVLGHDYMQAVRMAVTPYNGKAVCRTRRTTPRKNGSPRRR